MNTDLGILILRLGVGLIFAAHGAQKVFGWWGGPGFAGWKGAIEGMGLCPAGFWAAVSAYAELLGGLMLAVGFLTPLAAAALVGQGVVMIKRAHWARGFWNAKGGIEFPLVLWVGAVAVAVAGAGVYSVDNALGISLDPAVRLALIAMGILGGVAAAWWPLPSAAAPRGLAAR